MTPKLHPHPKRFRPARLSITLAAALALWGCTGEHSLESLGPDGDAEIDSVLAVDILPPSATLETGQLAKFSAREFRLAGDTVAAAVEWSASGGSITPLGLFSSKLPGKFTIIGWRWNRRGHRQSDTSTVVVVPPVPNLMKLTITPAQLSLVAGATASFTVAGRLSDSSITQVAVVWQASGGTIDGAGSYASGTTPGNYQIIARNIAGTVADTAEVTVAAPPTPPAPPVPTLAEVVLTPAAATVAAGATVRFATYGRTSASDSVAVTPTYTAGGGTLGGNGVYTAGQSAGTYRVIAASSGFADTSTVTVTVSAPAPVLAKVLLTPASVTLAAGGTKKFSAYGTNSAGDSVGVTVTYSATGGAISTSGGYTAGSAAGGFRVIATSAGGALADTANVTITGGASPPPATRVGFYVASNGSSSGDGSLSRPWDLGSALSGGKSVRTTDTIWVRGGTYRGEYTSSLNGAVVRQMPGERATIDGSLYVAGSNTTFWGLEVMNSNPTTSGKMGVNVRGPGTKLVNLVVHDAGMSGIGTWMEAPNSEVYGSIIYNNGTHSNLDHGIYGQNQSGTKLLRDNILFDNLAYGIHLYTSDGQYTKNITVEGNVSFNNGSIASYGWRPDFFVGGSTPASGMVFDDNLSYRNDAGETADLGWYQGATHQDLTLKDNYFIGTIHFGKWTSITQSGNLIATSQPSGTKVVVRPNVYEAGRANIVVYNWGRQGSVSVDPGVLRSGDRYEVRNVQDFYGTPVLSGTYSGGSLSLPMTGVRPASPIGRSTASAPITGPIFDVFVVLKVQ